MRILETHIVPMLTEKIRLQEYAPTIFRSITTRSGIKKAIKRQEILIGGKTAKTSDWIKEGQKIELLQQTEIQKKMFRRELEVIFEDDFLAVINKPSGIPTSGNYFRTVENALPFNLSPSQEIDALPYPLPVHRLDNPTSGLLLIAKTRKAQVSLYQYFETKKIQKTYAAIVHGQPPKKTIFNSKIDGKTAITEIHSLKSLNIETGFVSLLDVFPKTGRTHQIRIHLSKNAFPILGDLLYGEISEKPITKGLFLAATGLQFKHPVSGKIVSFQLPLPKKFQKLFLGL